ncbi:MAG: dephospho-CoA kinase [Pseudomonadales bacterium]
MFVVGLTGGIGSGKTAVSDRFKALGVDIVDADIAARVIVEPGTAALKKIAEHFGNAILLADDSLDRATLRKKIFNDADEKQWLESLLHPLIAKEILRRLNVAQSAYAIVVSPLLIESQQDVICDRVLVIDVPEHVQVERTIKRDSNDEAQVKRIMASQASQQQRLDKADDVIDNTQGLQELVHRVDRLHEKYLELATEKTTKVKRNGRQTN